MNLKITIQCLVIILNISLSNDLYNIWENKLLFCLNQNIQPLEIIDNQSDNKNLNKELSKFNILTIEQWLLGATDNDYDKDIYLNRIYRITTKTNDIESLSSLKKNLESLDIIHSVEYEFKRRPLYTPNDQYYNNQWYLPDINSNAAWDFWDIDNGDIS